MNRDVDASSAVGNATLRGGADSRPSVTNPSPPESGVDDAENRLSLRAGWWCKKNELVETFTDENRAAARPVSVRESVKLRDCATQEKYEGDALRSRPWSAVLREFLGWYNDYRYMHLRLRNPDGDLVRVPMENSHQPRYGNKYYFRLKALERQVLYRYDDPHVVMLTLTGSTDNATGGPRCPADHLRDVVDPFGRYVRPALHRCLSHVDDWEYAKVLEHHKSGYGHMHVAVFVDGDVSEEDFRPAIDSHLKHCDIAGRKAHDYFADDADARPISVNHVDPDAHLKRDRAVGVDWLHGDGDLDRNSEDLDVFGVGNMSSYVAEYIGGHGKELFDRSMSELAFRAVCWATGTQRVTFSPGANDLISLDRDAGEDDSESEYQPIAKQKHDVPPEQMEKCADPSEDLEYTDLLVEESKTWELDGIGRVDREGEERFSVKNSGIDWRNVEEAQHIDPPNEQPGERPYRNLVAD